MDVTNVIGSPGVRLVTVSEGKVNVAYTKPEILKVIVAGLAAANCVSSTCHVTQSVKVRGSVAQPLSTKAVSVKVNGVAVRRSYRFPTVLLVRQVHEKRGRPEH